MNVDSFTTMNTREHLASILDGVIVSVLSPSADVRTAADKLAVADKLMLQLLTECNEASK